MKRRVIILGMPRAATTSLYQLLIDAGIESKSVFKEPGTFFEEFKGKDLPDSFVDATTDYFFAAPTILKNTLGIDNVYYLLCMRKYKSWINSFLARLQERDHTVEASSEITYSTPHFSERIDISPEALVETVKHIVKLVPKERLILVDFEKLGTDNELRFILSRLSIDRDLKIRRLNQYRGVELKANLFANQPIIRWTASKIPFARQIYMFLVKAESMLIRSEPATEHRPVDSPNLALARYYQFSDVFDDLIQSLLADR